MRKIIIIVIVVALILIAGGGVMARVVGMHHKRSARSGQSSSVKPAYLVSLGDSVAAGAGLPITGTDSTATVCGQSSSAYPYLVARAKNLRLQQFACSGATIPVGILGPQTAEGQSLSPQLNAAIPYLPGSDVLITIGANDVDWVNELRACMSTNCETASNSVAFQQKLGQLKTSLDSMLQDVQSHHPRKIILNTYYQLISKSDTCLADHGTTPGKIAWVNSQEAALNQTIANAAKAHDSQVVDISFSGHLLCSADPWIQSLSDPAPLHPTAAGQAQIAAQDIRVL